MFENGFVLLDSEIFSFNQLILNLEQEWQLKFQNIISEENTATFSSGGFFCTLNLVPSAIPNGEVERYAKGSYYCRDAIEIAKKYKAHLMITVMKLNQTNKVSTIDCMTLYSKLLASCLIQDNAIGVYTSNTVFSSDFYREKCQQYFKTNQLPIILWIYIGSIKSEIGNSVYTVGMEKFKTEELEILDNTVEVHILLLMLKSVCSKIITNGLIIGDGQTFNFNNQKWTAVFSKSIHTLSEYSLKLKVSHVSAVDSSILSSHMLDQRSQATTIPQFNSYTDNQNNHTTTKIQNRSEESLQQRLFSKFNDPKLFSELKNMDIDNISVQKIMKIMLMIFAFTRISKSITSIAKIGLLVMILAMTTALFVSGRKDVQAQDQVNTVQSPLPVEHKKVVEVVQSLPKEEPFELVNAQINSSRDVAEEEHEVVALNMADFSEPEQLPDELSTFPRIDEDYNRSLKSKFHTPSMGFNGYFINGSKPSVVVAKRSMNKIDLHFSYDYLGIPSNSFVGYWIGNINVPQDGYYQFPLDYSWADFKLMIDDYEIVNDSPHSPRKPPRVYLKKGKHLLRVEYKSHWHTVDFSMRVEKIVNKSN